MCVVRCWPEFRRCTSDRWHSLYDFIYANVWAAWYADTNIWSKSTRLPKLFGSLSAMTTSVFKKFETKHSKNAASTNAFQPW